MTTLKKRKTTPVTKAPIERLRNVGISAHIDSGKTTLTERILFYGGRIHKMREVRGGDGGAFMDSDPIEKRRGITIASAVTRVNWNDHAINIIDTPGHVDFTVEVERSLRVLDGAVLVLCASRGVQSQSLTVDRQMKRYGVPRIAFINKMDRLGANSESVIHQMRKRLNDNAVAIQFPMGSEDAFVGVIDLITMEAVTFDGEFGEKVQRGPIPAEYQNDAEVARSQMLDSLAMLSDELMEAMLTGEQPTAKMIRKVIRTGTLALQLTAVLFGSAYKNKGVQAVLDAITEYLPSPKERKVIAHDISENEVQLECESDLPLVAMAFKTVVEKFGQLTFLRVYQGTLQKGTQIVNVRTGKPIRFGRLVRMHADKREDLDIAYPGDIVGVVGIDCFSGDTFADRGFDARLETFVVADPVIQLSIAPKNRDDADKLAAALARFVREDPTFSVSTASDSGETLIAGMGQLHLQVYVERIETDYECECIVGTPSVAYQERPSRSVDFEHQFKKMSGGPGQFAYIVGRMDPLEGDGGFAFEDSISGGRLEQRFIPAVRKGFEEALHGGPLGGFPVVGVAMTLVDGKQHENDSSEMSFRNCAAQAMRNVILPAAGLRLWEPVMELEIEIAESFIGAISGHLSRKRGVVTDSKTIGDLSVVIATVPLAELFDYSHELRSMTQGTGTFNMTPAGYRPVPRDVEEEVLSGRKS
jgi:elongation factor G